MSAMPAAAQEIAALPVAQKPADELPAAQSDPLAIDFKQDPILALARGAADGDAFRAIVRSAVEQNAIRREAEANIAIAKGELDEAEAGFLPTVDLSATSYRTLARDFGDDPFNLLESSRPRRRTDVVTSADWVVFDWWSVQGSVRAAQQRLIAAGFARDAALTELTTQIVISWYSAFAYQHLERFAQAFETSLGEIEQSLEKRIELGVSPPSDRERVAALQAESAIQSAQFLRRRLSAEARLAEATGLAEIPKLQRPPYIGEIGWSRDLALNASLDSPQVLAAQARERAARLDAKVAVRSQAPRIALRVEGGQYGIFDDEVDYDVRASVSLRYRLFGGGGRARIDQARARSAAASATADRVVQEAEREAAIAWADVAALEDQLVALEAAYKAARINRDVVQRRFAALRGSLFDVVNVQNAYLAAAVAYIEGLTQLDAARYTLLARTGRVLEVFIPSAAED